MRILFDYQAFSIQSLGGISRYVLELGSRVASSSGVELRLFAGWHRSQILQQAAPDWAEGRYVRPWPKTGRMRHAVNGWLNRRYARKWRPQLIHETYFRTGAAYLPDVPTVLTVYDLTYFVLPIDDAEARKTRRAQQAAIARADRIICISESTRRDLLRFFSVDPQRVRVIPLAGFTSSQTRDATSARPEVEGAYLLHVGLRHSYKNFDVILQALAGSPRLKAQFRIVAYGGPPFSAEEINRMRQLGLDPSRVLHREGDDRLLGRYYAHASVFVCPSLYEGFGLPPLEAMIHGCPVLCSNRGSLPEVTGDAALGFDPAQPADLAKALATVADSPGLAADLRTRGFQRSTKFSWDKCASETLAVYRELLG